ncbi:LysR substrate-binding domain-containing protein [Shimia sp. NS0008-38b]|uniref:LysR substrate-binding domain-containing protein n=1 Tax=Shimia sp. NS0008-38b TaxID=3127653 RepID=UPI003105E733
MSRRHYDLPPFTALSAFEAAARHLSFKSAAQELSVTPGAVSHQIKALEGDLGTALFERQHRGVKLTPEGEALYGTLASAFDQVSRQLSNIRRIADDDSVTVGSTTAVAALWLSPAIIRFWREYPEISVHQITQDRPILNAREYDFFINYGKAAGVTLPHTPIFRDELVAVAATDLARDLTGSSLSQLARQRLIHLDGASPTWTKWSDWFQSLGYSESLAIGTKVTSYSVALQLARKGAGVALGWRRLIQPMLESKKLSIIEPYALAAPNQFHLVGLPDSEQSKGALALKQWLLKEAGAHTV